MKRRGEWTAENHLPILEGLGRMTEQELDAMANPSPAAYRRGVWPFVVWRARLEQDRRRRLDEPDAAAPPERDAIEELCDALREAGGKLYWNTAYLAPEARVRAFRVRAWAFLHGRRAAVRHVEFGRAPRGAR